MRNTLNSRIFKIIYTMFGIMFGIILILYLIFSILVGKNLFGYTLYIVPDNSMHGVYEKKDVVITEKIDKILLKTGNDIVYYGTTGGLEGKLIIHRIVKIDNTDKKNILFTTQGIKSSITDPAITADVILGKVIGKVPVLTELNHLIRNQIGFSLIVFLPLLAILIIEITRTCLSMKLEKINLDIEDKNRGQNEEENKE
ncbi:MAG: hypothetical protein IKE63_06715 [Bacilli bacterium]|nr:hypothetical protein [Bacilli bacterium]